MKKKDYPCECGHPFKAHIAETRGRFAYCYRCFEGSERLLEIRTHWVHDFQADNLKFLEQQHDKR